MLSWRGSGSFLNVRSITAGLVMLSLCLAKMNATPSTESRVTLDLPEGAESIPAGPVAPRWDSIEAFYQVPDWLERGKFGIFIHWGVFCVPAKQSEWYGRHMYSNDRILAWHREHYGDPDVFGYKDFIPELTFSRFDPEAWAELFRKAGACYVMPVAEHHDGFAMYDSAFTRWDVMEMGPHRDILGDLAEAVRSRGLVFGLSNHRMEHWGFMYPKAGLKTDLFDPEFADFYGPPQPEKGETEGADEVMKGLIAPQSEAFLEEWLMRMQELVDRYQPQIVFFDNGINSRALDPIKLRFAAYYYNRAVQWGKQVTLTTKQDAYLAGSVKDFERGRDVEIAEDFWQCDTSIAHNSWGYIDDIIYRNAGELVRELVDCVSKNGGYLLNIAPRADGTLPEEQQLRLLEIGAWLKQNGEAIYSSKPWLIHREGPTTELPKAGRGIVNGMLAKYSPEDMRFTVQEHEDGRYTLYAILFDWPGNTLTVTIRSLMELQRKLKGSVENVHLLGYEPKLDFSLTDEGLMVKLPPYKPNEYAFVLKLEGLRT